MQKCVEQLNILKLISNMSKTSGKSRIDRRRYKVDMDAVSVPMYILRPPPTHPSTLTYSDPT